MRTVSILGTGSYAPERVLTNQELETMVDTTDAWITERTGIKRRHIAAENENASDLAHRAGERALEAAGLTAQDIDLILVATATPDTLFPSTACWVQRKLGAQRAAAFDLSAACSGFLYALVTAKQFIASGTYERVLVIGAEKLSAFVDWKDRNTCVLFGDAAGAVVLGHKPGERGIESSLLGSDGRHTDILKLPGGGTALPCSAVSVANGAHYLQMSGKEVFKLAVTAMQNAAVEAIDRAGIQPGDIDLVIPHQANLRIIDAISQRLRLPSEKFYINLQEYGNTSAASIPVALDEAVRSGRVKRGDRLLLVAFGGGLTWASSVVTY